MEKCCRRSVMVEVLWRSVVEKCREGVLWGSAVVKCCREVFLGCVGNHHLFF